jgi:hypothetical protein
MVNLISMSLAAYWPLMDSQPLSHASGSAEPSYVEVGSGALMVSQDFAGVGAAKGGGFYGDVGEGACCASCCGAIVIACCVGTRLPALVVGLGVPWDLLSGEEVEIGVVP